MKCCTSRFAMSQAARKQTTRLFCSFSVARGAVTLGPFETTQTRTVASPFERERGKSEGLPMDNCLLPAPKPLTLVLSPSARGEARGAKAAGVTDSGYNYGWMLFI